MPFRKKGSRFWHYDFQVGGRRFHGSCGTEDHREAKAVEAQARVAARAGKSRKKGSFTVAEALGTYWSDVCQHQPSASTARSQASAVLAVLPGRTTVPSLTTGALFKAVAKMRATVTNATVNRRLDMLKRSIGHMAKMHEAEVPDIDWKALKTRESEERVRVLTSDEERRLFAALRPDLVPMVKFALATGRRKAEVCGLQWKDVDLEAQRIWFSVKGGKRQSTPLTAGLRALLLPLPRSNVLRERTYVFTFAAADGERYRINSTGGYIWELWRAAVREADIPDFRFHDCRHTFATRMLRMTGNIAQVSKMLGHSTIETTTRYAHVLDDDLADAMERFTATSPDEKSRRKAD